MDLKVNSVFLYAPAVFAVGNTYQIMVVTERELLFFAEVNGKRYYDHSNGVIRSKTRIHRAVVPMAELDAAKKYTIGYRLIKERKGDFSETGEIRTEEFVFRPMPLEGKINIYQIADAHQKPLFPHRAGQYYGKDLHLLIINGDTYDYCNAESDFDYLYSLTDSIAHGEIPVVFAKGNHDNKGVLAEKLEDYTPTENGRSYYTFRLGRVWGLVLDCGENCADESPEYGNTVCHHQFRLEETEYIKSVIVRAKEEYLADGVEFRVIVSHCAVTNVREKPFDIEVDIYREWVELINRNIRPDFIISGHLHITTVGYPGGALDTLGQTCPVIIGAYPVGWQTGVLSDFIGCAVELTGERVRVKFTDSSLNAVETHEFKARGKRD